MLTQVSARWGPAGYIWEWPLLRILFSSGLNYTLSSPPNRLPAQLWTRVVRPQCFFPGMWLEAAGGVERRLNGAPQAWLEVLALILIART